MVIRVAYSQITGGVFSTAFNAFPVGNASFADLSGFAVGGYFKVGCG